MFSPLSFMVILLIGSIDIIESEIKIYAKGKQFGGAKILFFK